MEKTCSLWEVFEEVPDPRAASGRRYPLQAILTLASVAMLAGARSLYAIAQFARDRGIPFADSLGFTRGTTPCCTTLHYLFVALDEEAFEKALSRWWKARAAEGWKAMSFDGKKLRGTQGHQLPGVHVLAAYAHEAEVVLKQIRVEDKTNEHKAALEAIRAIPIQGKVVTGDAMFCQRDLSREIVKRKGEYIWPVKDNQPDLRASIAMAFDDRDVSPSRESGRVGGAGSRRAAR